MASSRPIGFFDSGVGLLSILIETKKLLPLENFVIFADQDHNPYGEKSANEIRQYAATATEFLIKKHQIKTMVLACNTASVLALDYLRKRFDIHFVGTVPAIKPAYQQSKSKRIAIMSTPATTKSHYLSNLIKKHAPDAKVLKIGCPGLEEAIEVLNYQEIEKLLGRYIKKIKQFDADFVVLGCTHYPLIKEKIQKLLGEKVMIIDSGEAIARQIKKILTRLDLESHSKTKDYYYTTGDEKLFSKVTSILLKNRVQVGKAQT